MSNNLRPNCKICDAPGRLLCTLPAAHDPTLQLQHKICTKCGLVYVANQLSNDELGVAYAARDCDAYYSEIHDTEANKFETARRNLERVGISPSASLLDVGTGNGDFLLHLKAAGFQHLSGHEIPGNATPALDRNGIRVYRDYDFAALPTGHFDAITMMDVMEHVPDPHHAAIQAWRALKPGGVWYFHTPFVTRLDRSMHVAQKLPGLARFGRAWQRCRTSVYHLQNYTARSIEQLASASGFETVDLVTLNELSWPLARYLRVYLCDPLKLPAVVSYLLMPFAAPFIANGFMNPNKGIVTLRKPNTARQARAA